MTGESLPVVLVDRLRAALDEHEAGVRPLLTARGCRECGGESREDLEGELRTIQAHRRLLDRHRAVDGKRLANGERTPICQHCYEAMPCEDVAALASIYFPESDAT